MALLQFKQSHSVNGKSRVVVDPKSLMLAPFQDIWNSDQSETKDYANDILCYVHIVSQLDAAAPFYNSSFDEVRFLAKSQIFRNMEHQFSEEEEIMIQNALDVYIKDNEMSEERMLQVYNKKIDEMRLELEVKKVEITRNVDSMTNKVTYSTNAKMITDVMKEIGNILKIKEDLKVQIENARASGDKKIRANRNPSFLEKQLMKSQSDARAREESAQPGAAPGSYNDSPNSDVHRPEQQEIQGNGSEPQTAEEAGPKLIEAPKRSYRRKQAAQDEAPDIDEEF